MKAPPLLLAGISFFGMALPNHAESKPAAAPGDPFVKKADQPEIKEGAAPWRTSPIPGGHGCYSFVSRRTNHDN